MAGMGDESAREGTATSQENEGAHMSGFEEDVVGDEAEGDVVGRAGDAEGAEGKYHLP